MHKTELLSFDGGKKITGLQGMVARACNPRVWEVEVEG